MELNRESLRKEINHGTPGYPLGVYDNYFRYPQYSKHLLEIHWHDEMEFLFADRGPMLFRLNDTAYTLNTGQAIVIPPGVIHMAESIEGKPFHFRAIVFNLSLIDKDRSDACHQKYFMHFRDQRYHLTTVISQHESWGKTVVKNLKKICRLFNENTPGFELGINSALYEVFFQFISSNQLIKGRIEGAQHEIARFKKVFEHVSNNFSKKITIEDLANKSHLSKYHFIRIFKRMTGRTPLDYLNHFRMQQAAKMLEADKLKIIDIAYEVGINDSSYFTKLFYKHFGVTPSTYRGE